MTLALKILFASLAYYVTPIILIRRTKMKVFKVTFEVVHLPNGIPIPIFFHPAYHVEARSFEEAIKRAEIAFNSHEENKKLEREIVKLESVTRPDDEDLILKLED